MSKVIYCLAEQALQFDAITDLRGGGERVLADFVTLLKENGYIVKLYQFSFDKITTKFRGHNIHCIGNIPRTGNRAMGYKAGLEYFYSEAVKNKADGIYLLSMNLSVCTAKIPTITVSHGINFNHCERNNMFKPIDGLENFKNWIRNATCTISCDTDTMHMMSVYYPENIKKMTYIPNYVDLNKFTPKEKLDDGIFRILYPRRLQDCRGYHILMKSADDLLSRYDNIEIIFAGKGNEAETNILHNWMKTKDNRVRHVIYEPDEMPKAYENISVGLVPTCYAEGTSLSLLELIASKICPISSWIGGLSDVVQKDVNGLLIEPNNADELTKAIEYTMNNPEHVNEMRENGQRMIKHFGKDVWDKRILDVVKKVYGEA